MRGYHLVMTFVWPALAIPTAIWWKSSVLWVAILSLYANFASEFSAWHASKAQEQSEGGDNKE